MEIEELCYDNSEVYCPFTSDPIGKDEVTGKPIFEGDCIWLTCNLSRESFQLCAQLENELRMNPEGEEVTEGS